MGNKSLIFLMLFLFSISFITAYETHQQDTNYTYVETVANADSCNLTAITYPDGTTADLDISMSSSGFRFTAFLNSSNFSQLGVTCWDIICYDADASPTYVSGTKCLEVTVSGIKPDLPNGLANMLLIGFFIALIFGLHTLTSKINFESWHNSIIKKYENKNYIKLVLGSIAYNIMKNVFVLYYLIGFPIIMSLTDVAYKFGVTAMVDILGVILSIYTVGVIIVGIYFFSHVQEWLMNLLGQIKDMDWGVS